MRVAIQPQGNRAAVQGLLELGQELAAEDLGEDAHGQEEVRPGGDPARVAGIQTPAGDNAVQMRVEEQELGPGVQDGGEADLGTQAAAGDLRQGLGDRGEEQVVGDPGGGAEEVVQVGGYREDDMEVRDGQQIVPLGFEPPRFLQSLALGAMPIPTGVVRDLLMTALRARAPVATQSGSPAVGKGLEDSLLSGRQTTELRTVRAHDVGELHAAGSIGFDRHDAVYVGIAERRARSGSRSSGLWVSCR